MKRYGMMGGTFNPIHLAHLYIAYEAKEELNLDKIIFMVAGNPPHKKESKVIDSKYRYNMVQSKDTKALKLVIMKLKKMDIVILMKLYNI